MFSETTLSLGRDRWCEVPEASTFSALKPLQMTLRYGWWDALGIRSIALWARRDVSTLLRTRRCRT